MYMFRLSKRSPLLFGFTMQKKIEEKRNTKVLGREGRLDKVFVSWEIRYGQLKLKILYFDMLKR